MSGARATTVASSSRSKTTSERVRFRSGEYVNEAGSGAVAVESQGFAKPSMAHHFEARGLHKGVVAFVVFPESSSGCAASSW